MKISIVNRTIMENKIGKHSTKMEIETWPVKAKGYWKDIWGQNKPKTKVY